MSRTKALKEGQFRFNYFNKNTQELVWENFDGDKVKTKKSTEKKYKDKKDKEKNKNKD